MKYMALMQVHRVRKRCSNRQKAKDDILLEDSRLRHQVESGEDENKE